MKLTQCILFLIAILLFLFVGIKYLFSRNLGTFNAGIAVFDLPTDYVQQLLPIGLTLYPQNITRPGYHPVFAMFGHQSNVYAHEIPPSIWSMNYFEQSLFVPFTKMEANQKGPFLYGVKLFLDSHNGTTPTLIGRLYGFNKHLAPTDGNISTTSISYSVYDPSNISSLYFHSDMTFSPKGVPAPSFPNYKTISTMLNQQFIGVSLWNTLICCDFDWKLENATLWNAIGGSFTYFPGWNFNFPGNTPAQRNVQPVDQGVVGGAWQILNNWVMTDPWKECTGIFTPAPPA